LDWKAKVELFEKIRREYTEGVGTILGVAKKLGVHRRMVREAIENALPDKRKPTTRAASRCVREVVLFIHQLLEADRQAPVKQRHTAQRIWERVQAELPQYSVSERTVRRQVQTWKQQQGARRAATYISQQYEVGREGQVDWYEAYADLGGERVKLHVFSLRSMYSGAAFHRAYWRPTQLAFLDAHQRAFEHFGGLFNTLRYDNLKSAVKQILRGKRREESARFIAFRSHYLFAAEFCTPARGNEKGGVEEEIGRFRRRWWAPVPKVSTLDELNAYLEQSCRSDHQRTIAGRDQSVRELFETEQPRLKSVTAQPFDLSEQMRLTVDAGGCVRVKTNRYSTPLNPGTRAEVKLDATHVEVRHQGQPVARHERCYKLRQEVLALEHYLGVLERKPGALEHSKALAQYRQAGLWPDSFDRFWRGLIERQGRSQGTRSMIDLLRLIPVHGHAQLRSAIEAALACGSHDAATVRYALSKGAQKEHNAPQLFGTTVGYHRPLPVLDMYDQLLGKTAEVAQ
jgi:transposase